MPIAFENTYANLPEDFFAPIQPMPVSAPTLIVLNKRLAVDLNIDVSFLESEVGLAMLSGNSYPAEASPLAMAYAGQQFGNWSPQLGDGRALLLGEVIATDGLRYDLQLKGSGPTPFSRGGDGRAWLGPVLREYLVSEAMAALDVPTTRALAAVSTGDMVYREEMLPGAIVTRTSRSLIRVGTFQYFLIRQDLDNLKVLADYTTERLYPHLLKTENRYLSLLEAVTLSQAQLIAKWMALGFIHGVMNTDNVSIAGETIDYGPCAFMDAFHPDQKFSSIDEAGRYAYGNQPRIAHWNIVQFAQTLLPLIADDQEEAVNSAQGVVNTFPDQYLAEYQSAMNAKLGISGIEEGDTELLSELLGSMTRQKADFTLTFHNLTHDQNAFKKQFDETDVTERWLQKLEARQDDAGRALMRLSNPAIIPRNHRVEQAIRAAIENDFEPFHRLNKALKTPFEFAPGDEELMLPPGPKEIVCYTFCGT